MHLHNYLMECLLVIESIFFAKKVSPVVLSGTQFTMQAELF